jgi:hypothetical protein
MSNRDAQRALNQEALALLLIGSLPVDEIAIGFLFGGHGIGDAQVREREIDAT